jgi:hypothetical protein
MWFLYKKNIFQKSGAKLHEKSNHATLSGQKIAPGPEQVQAAPQNALNHVL